jgi:hypothetical protein
MRWRTTSSASASYSPLISLYIGQSNFGNAQQDEMMSNSSGKVTLLLTFRGALSSEPQARKISFLVLHQPGSSFLFGKLLYPW